MPFSYREGGPQNDGTTMEERETAYAQLITAEPEFLVSEVRKGSGGGGLNVGLFLGRHVGDGARYLGAPPLVRRWRVCVCVW